MPAPQFTMKKWIISFVLLLGEYWQVQPEERLTETMDSYFEIPLKLL